jgi:class 3 adenylate cyclase
MSLADELETEVGTILSTPWSIRDGNVVPINETVALAGGGVNLNAVMVYTDLASSTQLASMFDRRVAAKVLKAFLICGTRVIRANGGFIRSFDGDRVMGVFVGNRKHTRAARAALMMNWAMLAVLKPKIAKAFPSLATGGFVLRHCTGVDVSDLLVVRSGIRDNNDLIWVGRAPSFASKLAGVRDSPFHSFMSDDVFDKLAPDGKFWGSPPQAMWEKRHWAAMAPIETEVYRSSWWLRP